MARDADNVKAKQTDRKRFKDASSSFEDRGKDPQAKEVGGFWKLEWAGKWVLQWNDSKESGSIL